jgi:hypothetical protein
MNRIGESSELTGCTEFAYLLTLSDLRALRSVAGVQNRGSAQEGKLSKGGERGRQTDWLDWQKKISPERDDPLGHCARG